MNELIKITEQNGNQVVSARELYLFLEIKTDFTDWCKRMFDYGFEENKDYSILLKFEDNPISKSNPIDFALTLDTAKEISMLQRSEKGKNARQYFIACEKKLRNVFQLPTNFREALLLAADQQLKIENQEKIILKLEPRSLYFEKMVNSDGLISMEECAKLLNIKDLGRNKLYKSLRESKVIMKFSTTPYQHFVTKGYFELKEELIEIQKSTSVVRKVNTTTYVTQKGLAFIFKLFGLTEKAA